MSDAERLPTVMVVGHDQDEVSLLSSVLHLKGFDVLEAENGNDAVDLANRWRPELILIELRLPIVGGFTTIRSLMCPLLAG